MSADTSQLDAVHQIIQRAIGTSVAAVYHYGSGVLGGLKPLSDLDVLVVVERPLPGEARVPLKPGRSSPRTSRPRGRSNAYLPKRALQSNVARAIYLGRSLPARKAARSRMRRDSWRRRFST